MAHTTKDQSELLSRVRRIRGQVEAIERALDGEHECSSVLQLMAACRGAFERFDGGSAGGSHPIPRPRSEIWQERSPSGSGRGTHRRSADVPEVVPRAFGIL